MRSLMTPVLLAAVALANAPAPSSDKPETVLVTYHAKVGSEAALLRQIDAQWSTLQRLHAAVSQPHLVLRAHDDAGKPLVFEVFTWTSRDIPDHAPAEILAIWKAMGRFVEAGATRRGIEIREVVPVNSVDRPGGANE